MTKDIRTSYWFKRRRYGYGWFPSTWQGWTVLLIYLSVIIVGAFSLRDVPKNTFNNDVAMFLMVFILSTLALIFISYRKGPSPKWRWGKTNSDDPDEDW